MGYGYRKEVCETGRSIRSDQLGHNKILSLIAEKPQISISALAKQCEVSEKAMRITLERLKAENVIKRVGASFGDIWKSFYRLLWKQNNTNYGKENDK